MGLIIAIIFIVIGLIVETYTINNLQRPVVAFFLALLGRAMWMSGFLYIARLYF